MKGEVLVKARPRFQYDMSGKANMYFEPERGSGGSAPKTKRERLAGLAGGLVGVLGGLTGKHRSLGSLLGGMYAGGAQGAGLVRGLAGKTVMPKRRAELELEAQSRAKRGKEKGVERMKRRVERAEEAQDRINAPAGANTQGVVSQLRDKVRVRRTPDYMRRDFREAEAAEAERAAQAQAKQQRRELSRQDILRARALRGMSAEQIEQLGEMDSAGLERMRRVVAVLDQVQSPYTQVGPTFGEQFPDAQPPQLPQQVPQGPIPAPLHGVASKTAQDRQMHPSGNANNYDHDAEGLNQLPSNTPQELGADLANGQQPPQETRGFGPDELRSVLEMGLNEQQ